MDIFAGMDHVAYEVLLAMMPLVAFSVIAQVRAFGWNKDELQRSLTGYAMVFAGLVMFLQGVTAGFFPMAARLGGAVASVRPVLLIPIGFVLGFSATIAEPAVRILMGQLDEESGGSVRSSYILYALAFGVGFMVATGMARLVYAVPIAYLLVPGYVLAMLMARFSDPTFVAIAFDSGGVATGPMAVAFLASLAVGASNEINGGVSAGNGFGLVALVALAPILSVMVLGLIHSRQRRRDQEDAQ
jgi:hypothetical protein